MTEPKTPTGAPVDERFSNLPPDRRIQNLEGDEKKREEAAAQRPKSASPPTERAAEKGEREEKEHVDPKEGSKPRHR